VAYMLFFVFFSSRRRHTRSVSAFLLNRSSDLTIKKPPRFGGMKTYNWEGVNPDGYFLDKLEQIPSALPSFQKLFKVSATALSIPGKISTTQEAATVTTIKISFAVAPTLEEPYS